jgi:hypothetical protein
MKDTDKFNGISRRLLSCTIAAMLFAPAISVATSGQQVADGTALALSPDDYETDAKPALYILNGGSITADGGVVVSTTGLSGYGAWVRGADSVLVFNGGGIVTSGQDGHGVYVTGGGAATIGSDAVGIGTTISTSGAGTYGLYNSGSLSRIDATHLTISTAGRTAHAVRNANGTVNLTDVNLVTTGAQADGIYADTGSHTNLNNVNVTTQGQAAHAAYFDGTRGGAEGYITGGSYSTSGFGAHGVYATAGAYVSVADATIQTSGAAAYGVMLDQPGSGIDLNNVAISTSGAQSFGLWLIGANDVVTAQNFSVLTTGDAATAFNNRGTDATLTNGVVATSGIASHALYASQEYGTNTAIHGTELNISTQGSGSIGAYARLGAGISLTDSRITTYGDNGSGVDVEKGSTISLTNTPVQTSGSSAYGVYSAGTATIREGSILTQGKQAFGVAIANGGQASLSSVDVVTQGAGAYAAVFGTGGGRLAMNGGTLSAEQSDVFGILGSGVTTSDIQLFNGVQAIGGSGVLINVANPDNLVSLTMDRNVAAQGDIIFDPAITSGDVIPPANVTVALSNGSQWTGATEYAVSDLSLASGSLWTVTDNSSVGQLALNDSSIQFTPPASDGYKTLTVNGDFSGTGGAIGMNTLLNEGGPLSNQQTDRLLIQGNVTTTGTTVLDVTPQGTGASAPIDKNGAVDATDGISLVQVGGMSRADAFALRYGYVAVGPYQYKLYAFGPGQADASQNLLPSGELNWDYRLAPKYVEIPVGGDGDGKGDGGGGDGDHGGDGDGEDHGGGSGVPDPAGGGTPVNPPPRDLVAQLPSYIVAPTALFTYGDALIDTLHQRLGEIRDTSPSDPHGGELFVRYIGSQQRYASSHGAYGYDFDQQINAVQLGGSLLSLTNDASSLRIGWALDKGSTRVTPRVFDSEDASFGRYDAHGVRPG